MPITLEQLRSYAVARSLFAPTTLRRAMHQMGFVQADPIRAPARAQDLMLRHRVIGYRAGDLERRYAQLGIEEDFFINYGFVTREVQALMHPRARAVVWGARWTSTQDKRARLLLDFVRERGSVHPREVNEHFAHGAVRNYWGGSSNATTHLLDSMQYAGMLRVVRREDGIRIYATHEHGGGPIDEIERHSRIDALIDVAVRIYAPMPAARLGYIVSRIRIGAPQWRGELKSALLRAKQRLAHAHLDGIEWYWPADENPTLNAPPDTVRLLTPFDPIVWDRYRFEMLWGWTYRFEAYTPVAKRIRGYYAMPLLWRDRVIGWGNLSVLDRELRADFGYVKAPPRDRAFRRELAAELDRMRAFLRLE
jgi:uncharacterized protein YcaQ